jgi:tetratricopeptide (TPR) repeat protein
VIKPRTAEVLFEFHRLGDERFEEVCCHLLYKEPELEGAELYGRPRQRQFGVDATARRKDGSGIHTLSCKCYKSITKGQIATFSQEFLDHWDDHWSSRGVRRFILCIACNLRSHERQKEIEAERTRFSALGITFEAWGQRQLSYRVHSHPDIQRWAFEPWNSPISPSAQLTNNPPTASAQILSHEVVAQIAQLQATIEGETVAQLDAAQTVMKRGRLNEVSETLRAIRATPNRWHSLSHAVQARVLRMQGLIALSSGDNTQCQALLDEADSITPADEPRVRALLVLRTRGATDALDILSSPSTIDGALLHAALLIEADRCAEARALLTTWDSVKGSNAEWHRLSAYVSCVEGAPADGLRAIGIAESLAGEWLSVIETGAIVRYAAALSPVVRFRSGGLPEPVPPDFARQDDAARAGLLEASERFFRLAASETHLLGRQRLELWHFACLALLPDKTAEAQTACLALLNQTPVPPAAAFWALARGYDIPLSELLQRVEANVRRPEATVDDAQAAIACALAAGDTKKATAILKRGAAKFGDDRSVDVLALWRGRIALLRRRPPSADSLVDPIERLQATIALATKTADWSTVESLLNSLSDRPDVRFLACKALAGHGQWSIVATHAEALLLACGTADGVRLAAYAAYHTRQFDRVSELLDQHISLFPGASLPYELQRLRTYAAARRGDLHEALPLAATLAHATGDANDRAILVDLLLHAGDVERAAPIVRDLLKEKHWTAPELIRWIPALSNEAPDLARSLLRTALALQPDPSHAGFLLEWSYRLGLEREASQLLGSVNPNVAHEAGSIRRASLAEAIEYLRAHAKLQQTMSQHYLKGELPVHALVGPTQANVAQIWAAAFQGEADHILFIRHGNRPAAFFGDTVSTSVHLHIDITALLTIDQLDLLDDLDDAGIPLTFPHSLPTVLQILEQDIRPHQPSRLATLQSIADAVTQKALAIAPTTDVPIDEAAVVTFEVPAPRGPAEASREEVTPRPEIALGSLADELVRRAAVTPEEMNRVRGEFSGWELSAATTDPAALTTLIFDSNTLDVLINSGVFNAVRSHFTLRVTDVYHQHCLAELAEARRRTLIANRLRDLSRRIGHAVTDGRYRLLAEPAERAGENERTRRSEALMEPLLELLAMPPTPNAWVWIDDRYCTAYTFANNHPIVSTFEVLDHLKYSHVIDETRYAALLERLRRAGALILPVRTQEVMHWLRAAPIADAVITETPSLMALRLNFNRLLQLEGHLDVGSLPRHADCLPERACLLEAYRLARECLEAIWTADNMSAEERWARSDWVWGALRVEQLSSLPPGGEPEMRRAYWRSSLRQYLWIALSLSFRPAPEGMPSRRANYIRWFETELPEFAMDGGSATLDMIAEEIAGALLDHFRAPADSHTDPAIPQRALNAFAGLFIADLPEGIRSRLYRHERLVETLHLKLHNVITLRTRSFEEGPFWRALAAAAAGELATVLATDDTTFRVVAVSETQFELVSATAKLGFSNPDLALLAVSRERRLELLRTESWTRWIVSPLARRGIEDLADLPLAADRIRALHELREREPAARYAELARLLVSGAPFGIDEFFPAPADIYIKYLGLEIADNGSVDWTSSARAMVERLGATETLRRWSGLPVALSALGDKRVDVSAALIEEASAPIFDPHCLSPLRAMKLLEADLYVPDMGSTPPTSLVATMSALVHDWPTNASAFGTLLRWSERVWQKDPAWSTLPAPLRLACVWAHADRILSLLLKKPPLAGTVSARFADFNPSSFADLLPRPIDYDADVASPTRISAASLLVQGLTAALGADPRGLLQENLDEIIALVSQARGDTRLPTPTVLEDRRAGRNGLVSFLVLPPATPFHDQLPVSGIRPLAPDGKDQLREQTIQQLESDPLKDEGWLMLHTLGLQWLPSDTIDRVCNAFLLHRFPEGAADALEGASYDALADMLPYLTDDSRASVERELLAWAKRLATVYRGPVTDIEGGTGISRDAGAVLELGVALARHETLTASLEKLTQVAESLVVAWPGLAAPFRGLFSRAFRDCPEQRHLLWQTFVRLRTLP